MAPTRYGVEVFGFNPRAHNGGLVDVKPDALSLGSDRHALADNEAPGVAVIDVGFDSELRKRFSCGVTIKKLASVHCSEYVGHVYNLSTAEGAYWANGLIVHNCQSADYWKGAMAAIGYEFDPWLSTLTRELASENTNPHNHFLRSGLAFKRYGSSP